jgi:hypothetical protein
MHAGNLNSKPGAAARSSRPSGPAVFSQPLLELFLIHFNIPQDLAHETRPNRLAGVARNHRRSTICVPEIMMAASDS